MISRIGLPSQRPILKYSSGDELVHYIKVRVPVALLGALFDSLSLHIALLVVRQALLSQSNLSYLSHLSIDVLIAIAATFWVLFVFSVSGWIVSCSYFLMRYT